MDYAHKLNFDKFAAKYFCTFRAWNKILNNNVAHGCKKKGMIFSFFCIGEIKNGRETERLFLFFVYICYVSNKSLK